MISFRNVTEEDFTTLFRWLNKPHVKEFWFKNEFITIEVVVDKYSKRLEKGDVSIYIIEYNGTEIGFIQSYLIEDSVDFKVNDKIKGIDLYIGEKEYLHKGYGKDIIIAFVKNHIFNDNDIQYVGIDPVVNNLIAIKAYNKAGFKHINTEYSEINKSMTYYMIIDRKDINL